MESGVVLAAGRLSDVKAEASRAPTVSVLSRPSTQSTVRDGIVLRWNGDSNPMLRRPRTASDEGSGSSSRNSARKTKARFNVALRKQKVTGLVKAMTSTHKPAVVERTAVELSYEASQDRTHPYSVPKSEVLRQYHLQHGIELAKMDLPPVPPQQQPTHTGNPFENENEAVRQLMNHQLPTNSVRRQSQHELLQHSSAQKTRSGHVHNKACPASSYQRRQVTRKQCALDEYRRIVAIDSLTQEDGVDDAGSHTLHSPSELTSAKAFCSTLRPQTAVSTSVTLRQRPHPISRQHPRPKSCMPKLTFYEREPLNNVSGKLVDEQKEKGLVINSAPAKKKPRPLSCWLSPLEMSNVPADVKLKYVNSAERKRFSRIMTSTAQLLRNEPISNKWDDRTMRRLMAYKPKLDSGLSENCEEEAELADEAEVAHNKISELLERSRDDPILQKLVRHIQSGGDHGTTTTTSSISAVRTSGKGCRTSPLLIGSQTSRALLAGFYMLKKEYSSKDVS